MAEDGDMSVQVSRELSIALIGGAFGFIGIAIFASASYADKVAPDSLWQGNLAATISVVFLLLSVIFGGRGSTKESAPGVMNAFNLQALTGLAGVILLGVAAAIFAFNPRQDANALEFSKLEARLKTVEEELGKQRDQLAKLPVQKDNAPASSQADTKSK